MSPEVLVGVIGLSGALIGAGAAFAGIVYQQSRQAALIRVERRDALAQQAVDILMSELEKVRELAWSLADQGDASTLGEAFTRHVHVIQLATLRLPDADLREAIEAATVLSFGNYEPFLEHVGLRVPRIVMTATVWDVQKCLGAYLRQEERPETTFLFQVRDFYHSMLTVRRSPPRPS